MRSGAEDPHLVDVELVDDPPPAGGAPAPDDDPPAGRVRRHVRAWLAVAALVALVVVTGLGNVAAMRRDENRLAALADLPGFLDPLAAPLEVAWRAGAGTPVARTDTAVLVVGDDELRALDLADGHPHWARAVDHGQTCRPVAAEAGPDVPLVREVLCLPDADRGLPRDGALAVVDATTGAEVRRRAVAGLMFADVVDSHVLLTSAEPDGGVAVVAWDPATGVDLWHHRSRPRLLDALVAAGGGRYTLRHGVLAIGSARQGFALDAATGAPLVGEAARPGTGESVALPGGGEARWSHDRLGRPTEVTVAGRDGERLFTAPGVPWLARVSDGSSSDVLVVRRTGDQHLVGLDATTGRVRWDLPNLPWLRPSVLVSGVAVGVGPSRAVALDLGTGLRLWDHQGTAALRGWHALTDGRLVLLPREDGVGGLWLTARRLRTGDVAWEVPLPRGALSLQQVDGRTVLVRTATGLVALR
jgi:outer membrane protein assembly factor BamB